MRSYDSQYGCDSFSFMNSNQSTSQKIFLAVLVASLGYCVDVFDIVLFSIYRVQSLQSLGLGKELVLTSGVHILNMQLAGMMLGGILWGVIGDKLGRLQVLFGSILLYSTASIANAFVQDVDTYAWCRFLAGVGLAGEAGAAITLVAEILPKHKRGVGTAIVAAAGTSGAVLAAISAEFLNWRTAYLTGGALGLMLLVTRISVCESSLFASLKADTSISRGDMRLLFTSRARFSKYIYALLSGLPLFFSYYTLLVYTPEVGKALSIQGELTAGRAVAITSITMTIGDLASGYLSKHFRNRKIVFSSFVAIGFLFSELLMLCNGASATMYYVMCGCIGFGMGYWAIFLTTATEQFGTNIRVTVASTIPNFVRAAPIVMSSLVLLGKDAIGYVPSLQVVGTLSFAISFYAISKMRETYGVDLNYVELASGTRSLELEPRPVVEPEFKQAGGWS